ncbi:MAG: hypothetical protein IID40_11115 [Planctomycetes bacterium]|nr:hypothetical protein [Planctomycetota bacterium]
MGLAFKQFKVYTKVVLVLAVALAVGAVLLKNREHRVPVWFFGLTDPTEGINVVWLILCSAVGAIVAWTVLRATLGVVKDLREVARAKKVQLRDRSQQELAAKLKEQERRIDEKISKAIDHDA